MFIWSAIAHLVALTSPGPDTLIVIRESSLNGRSGGIRAAIGIGIGIYFHCLLAINGISLILLSDPTLSKSIGVIGGLYLFYIGLTMIIQTNNEKTKRNIQFGTNSLINGLVTNIFNIKAFMFFVSLFALMIDGISSIGFYLYPFYFSIVSSLWFIFLTYLLTGQRILDLNNKTFNNITAITLISIGFFIIINTLFI